MGQQLIKARVMKYERGRRNFFDTFAGKVLLIVIDYFLLKDFLGFGKTCFVFRRKVAKESGRVVNIDESLPISKVDSLVQTSASSTTVLYISSREDANRIIKITCRFCPNIKSINIINCRGNKILGATMPGETEGVDMKFGPISFGGYIRECRKIESIRIVACEVDNSIKEFLRTYGKSGMLKKLNLKRIIYRGYHIKDSHIPMVQALSNAILGNTVTLRNLKVHLSYDDVELSEAIEKCTNLQTLSLGFPSWSTNMLNNLSLMLKNLDILSYVTLEGIDITKTYEYFQSPKLSIKKIKLAGIGNIAHLVQLLAKNCKSLQQLSLIEYRGVESSGELCKAKNVKKLIKGCPKLTKIIISPMEFKQVKKLDGYLKKTKKLDLAICYQTWNGRKKSKFSKELNESVKPVPDVLEDFKIPKLKDKYVSDYHVAVTAYVRALKKGKPYVYKIVERILK